MAVVFCYMINIDCSANLDIKGQAKEVYNDLITAHLHSQQSHGTVDSLQVVHTIGFQL